MKQLLLSSALVILSLSLVYSGVAWAFEECLVETEPGIGEQFSARVEESDGVKIVDRVIHEPISVLHCVSSTQTFDALARSSLPAHSKQLFGTASPISEQIDTSTSPGELGFRCGRLPGSGGSLPSASTHVSRYLLLAVFLA